ncbi:hypothetical protein A9Y76_07030 [Ralstonia insidiosa]|uniref:Uncharacterized protein n=1 Tax=Ralstonia insidiosa TaxID=190721 RepID=A0A191ZVX0_9RALS|nr:hypothetical protein [Ralstonia insidiosa]ANJ72231.1 hypothetical protein A9Y76_07030 [Ralstonia insidiosa]
MTNKLSPALVAFGIALQVSSLFLFTSKAMAPVLLGGIVLTLLGLASFATRIEQDQIHQAQPQELEQEINGQAEFQFFKDKNK